MPDATLEAARDHATAARTIDKDVEAAHEVLDDIREAGVDFDHIVGVELVEEGMKSFTKSFDDMISSIEEKARAVAAS